MASIPIHNETAYKLTDDMMQYIIRDAHGSSVYHCGGLCVPEPVGEQSSMEPQEIASELSDEEHLNGGRCLRKSLGVCIAPCLQG